MNYLHVPFLIINICIPIGYEFEERVCYIYSFLKIISAFKNRIGADKRTIEKIVFLQMHFAENLKGWTKYGEII